jgi:putative ABC transport system permease protein
MAATLRATEGLQGLEVQAWNEREPYSGIYATVSTIFGVLAFIIVFVTALGVLNTMIMSVMERSAEVGVLRAMGLRKRGVVAMFLMEGLLIGVAGAVAGLGLGMIPAMYLETHGVTLGEGLTSKTGFPLASTIHANFTWGIACLSVSLGVLTAVLGSLIPAMRAAAIQPVNAMRRRR